MRPIGKLTWVIAEGYIPSWRHGAEPQINSHETAGILNAGTEDAHIQITVFFSDRQAAGPYKFTVPAGRMKHLRFNDLQDPEPVPVDTHFSSVIESDVPVVIEHARLDSRQPGNVLLNTVAYSGQE